MRTKGRTNKPKAWTFQDLYFILHWALSKLLLCYLSHISKNIFLIGRVIFAPSVAKHWGAILFKHQLRRAWAPHMQLLITASLLDMAVCLNKALHFILEKRKTRTVTKFIALLWWLTPFACGAGLVLHMICVHITPQMLLIPVLLQQHKCTSKTKP